ncbi:MAG: hypothetical protein NXI21_11335 [Alphaproteobacteria bacterium]|nr:hypothetical protein [Alphaproteobacteria bacterium]
MSDAPDLSKAAEEAARAEDAARPIEAAENPNPRIDYLVRLEGETTGARDHGGPARVVLSYVPDKRIVRQAAFRDYLAGLTGIEAGANLPERLALRILGDFNDELVPRWVQVVVATPGDAGHRVLVEDRQPKWDNRVLLARAAGL